MNLIDATTYCFRNALKFSGRANRYEFWNFVLFVILVSLLLVIMNTIVFGPSVDEGISFTMASDGTQTTQAYRNVSYNAGVLGNIFTVIVALPYLSVTWRRLHDTGRAGWFSFVPYLFLLAMAGVWYLTATPIVVGTLPETGEPITALIPSSFAPIIIFGLLGLVSTIAVFICLCRQSDPDTNRFGPNPNEVPS